MNQIRQLLMGNIEKEKKKKKRTLTKHLFGDSYRSGLSSKCDTETALEILHNATGSTAVIPLLHHRHKLVVIYPAILRKLMQHRGELSILKA